MALEHLDHGIDVLGAGEQEDRRRPLGDLRAHLLEERVMKVRDVLGFIQSARGASGDEPDREPRGAEERPDDGAGQGTLGGAGRQCRGR